MADVAGLLAAAAGMAPDATQPVQPEPVFSPQDQFQGPTDTPQDLGDYTPAPAPSPFPSLNMPVPTAPPSVPEQKRAEVASATDDKRVALGGNPSDVVYRRAAIARATGSGKETASGVEKDLIELSYDGLVAKYGERANGMLLGLAAAESEYDRARTDSRRWGQAASDAAINVASGLGNSILGIGALAAGGVDAVAGTNFGPTAANLIDKANKWGEKFLSPALQSRKASNADRGTLDDRDVQAQQKIDEGNDGAFVAGLKRFGRDVVNSVSNAVEDPQLLSEGVSQGIGSLFAAGPVTKTLSKVGTLALGAKAGSKVGVASAIGAMESGGSYVDTVNSLREMTPEQWAERSPAYRDMLANGSTHEKASRTLINRAGLLAAAATAPLAVAAGKLVPFEAHPLAKVNARSLAGNSLRETVEEFSQGATGQLSQNIAVQNTADETRNTLDQVGAQAGLGALYGFGSTIAVQGPGVAGRSALSGLASLGSKALDAGAAASQTRQETLAARAEKGANVSPEILKQATEAVVASAPEAVQTVSAAVDAIQNVAPDQKETAKSTFADMVSLLQYKPEDIADLSPQVQQQVASPNQNRFELLQNMFKVVDDPVTPVPEKLKVARSMIELMEPIDQEVGRNNKVLDQIDPASDAGKAISGFMNLLANVNANRTVNLSLAAASNILREARQKNQIPEVTEANVGTPEGIESAKVQIAAAAVDPKSADPAAIKLMAQMATSGKLKLSASQLSALVGVEAILNAASRAKDAKEAQGIKNRVSYVTDSVLTRKSNRDDVAPSAMGHATRVFRAMQANRPDAATEQLGLLQNFAQHMLNKIEAVNRQITSGNTSAGVRDFQAWNPNNQEWYTGRAPIIHNSPGSYDLAQSVSIEAQQLLDVYNGMVDAFPSLQGKRLSMVSLAPATVPARETKSVVSQQQEANPVVSRETPVRESQPVKPITSRPVYWNGLLVFEEFFDGMVPGEFKSVPLEHIPGHYVLSYITPNGKRISGGYDYNDHELWINDFNITSETGPSSIGLSEIKGILQKILKLHPNAEGVSGTRQTGARKAAGQENTEINFRLKDGKLVLFDPKVEKPAPEPKPAAVEPQPEPAAQPTQQPQTPVAAAQPEAVTEPVNTTPEQDDTSTTEATQEEPATVEEAAPPTVQNVFTRLLGGTNGVINRFIQAFRMPEKPRSRLTLEQSPLLAIQNALSSSQALQAFGETSEGRALPAEVLQALRDQVGKVPLIVARLNARLNTTMNLKVGKSTPAEDLAAGRDVISWVNRKQLNIAELNEDGSYTYNQQLIEAAALAAVQWLLSSSENEAKYDERAAAAILGTQEENITPAMLDTLNRGYVTMTAVSGLTSKIREYWGLNINNDVPMGFPNGILEGMAKEILSVLEFDKSIKNEKFTVQFLDDTNKLQTRDINIYVAEPPKWNDPINQAINALDRAVLVKPQDVRFFSPEEIAEEDHVLRNSMVPLTAQQKKAIEQANNVAYFQNTRMVDFYRALGEKDIVELFGTPLRSNTVFNVEHANTLEGQNRTLLGAYRYLMGVSAEMDARAAATNVEDSELPIYYAHNMHRAGRLQQLGAYTPQNTKLVREALISTMGTMDLSEPGSKQHQLFMLSLAQAIDFKPGIHKMTREDAIARTQKLLALPQVEPMLDVLEEMADTGKMPIDGVKIIKTGLAAMGVSEPNARVVNALMEYSRLQNSTSREERANFNTFMYIEADGVSNGPINGMMLLTTGTVDAAWVQQMRRGGLFFNGMKSLNEFFTQPTGLGEKVADLYQQTGNKVQELLSGFDKTLKRSSSMAHGKFTALNKMMDIFLPGVTFTKDGELIIDRKVVKNPLTISIYGSGSMGIAGKIRDAMLDEMYATMSQAAQRQRENPQLSNADAMFGGLLGVDPKERFKQFTEAFSELTKSYAYFDPETKKWVEDTHISTGELRFNSFQQYSVPHAYRANIRMNVHNLFVNKLSQGIKDTVGSGLIDGQTMVKSAGFVQSLYQTFRFEELYQQKLASLAQADPNFRPSHGLTAKEMRDLQTQVLREFPYVQTGKQSFYPAASQSTPQNVETSQTLDGKIKTDTLVPGPRPTPVSMAPYLVIGMGDGAAIQEYLTAPGAPKDSLVIFDGIHSKLTSIEADSVRANEAIYKSWRGNPMAALASSFAAGLPAMMQMNIRLNDSQRSQIFEAMRPLRLEGDVEALANRLTEHGQIIQARLNALEKIGHNIDQMASVESPYTHPGEDLSQKTDQEVADRIANLQRQELAKLQSDRKQASEVERQADEAAARQTFRDAVPGASQVAVYTMNNLSDLLKSLKLTGVQREVFNQIALSGAMEGFRVVSGSVQQIRDYVTAHQLTMPELESAGRKVHGVTLPLEGFVYLVDPSPEAVIHELVHAATLKTLYSTYLGEQVSAEVLAAVSRLDGMMVEFLDLNPKAFTSEQAQAYANARHQVISNLNRSDDGQLLGNDTVEGRTLAVGEFISWVLANQEMASMVGGTQDRTKLKGFVQRAFQAVRRMIFGAGNATPNTKNVLSKVAFDAAVLMKAQPTLSSRFGDLAAFMSTAFGHSERVQKILELFQSKIMTYINSGPLEARNLSTQQQAILNQGLPGAATVVRRTKFDQAMNNAQQMAEAVKAATFEFTPQEELAFEAVVSALALETSLDTASLNQIQAQYNHFTRSIDYTTFLDNPTTTDQNEITKAELKYQLLIGRGALALDEQGRSSLMPVFMALAMTNESFQNVLKKVPVQKSEKSLLDGMDGHLQNLGTWLMDKLSDRMSGVKRAANMQDAMSALANNLQEVALKHEGIVDTLTSKGGTFVDRVNDQLIAMVNKVTTAAKDATVSFEQRRPSSRARQALRGTTQIVSAIVNEQDAGVVSRSVISAMNNVKGWELLRSLISDLTGRSDSNKDVYDLIKQVRSFVQADRQHYREILPTVIAKQFSRDLSEKEWSFLHNILGKMDIAALTQSGLPMDVLKMLTNSTQVTNRIQTLENAIRSADQDHWNLIERKAKQLANFMNTGITGSSLLRNATAVARLLNEKTKPQRPVMTDNTIQDLDELISLYAYQMQSQNKKDALKKLVETEEKGMNFLMSYLQGQRAGEQEKWASPQGALNQYKGHIPSVPQEGRTLIVAEDARVASLAQKSMVRVGDYKGSVAELGQPSKGYYYVPVQSRMPFSQGLFQNVQETINGVDVNTGYTFGNTAGRIVNKNAIASIRRRQQFETPGNAEGLMPVFASDGRIVAYERSLDPAQLERLNHDTHLARMIGVWRGRQVEEYKAGIINNEVLQKLKEMYDMESKDPALKKGYVDIENSEELKDPVMADAVSLIPKETWERAKNVFGGPVMVRRDMLKDVIGERKASITDPWTGITRINPRISQAIKDISILFMGNQAYKWLLTGENEIRGLVTTAKQIIVVKSVIVPAMNFTSNIMHMMSRGVPMVTIIRQMPKKLAETHTYTKNVARKIELEAQLRAASPLTNDAEKIAAEIQAIDDSNRRMTIWPLIEAGEFSSISDAGISRDELLMTQGKLAAYITKLANKLPGFAQEAGRQVLITKDTALFQGLSKAVQYGDFLAKAVMYDDLTQRRKMPKAQALGILTEEFVNYDRLSGRTRGYLEDIGLLWFYPYKLRSVKVAASVLRNNPVHAFLSRMLPMPDMLASAGTPLDDNLISKGISGKLGYSIGPSMGFHAPSLHPAHLLMR